MIRLAIAIALLSGCAAHPATKPTAQPKPPDFCSNAQPIRINKNDRLSPATADAIIKHNETGRTLCGWKP